MTGKKCAILSAAICTVLLCGCVNIRLAGPSDETAVVSASSDESEVVSSASDGGIVVSDDTDMSDNLIVGGDFISPVSNWGLYTESGGSASFDFTGGKLRVRIYNPGRVGHAVQLYYDGFQLLKGGRYHFSADVSSDVERSMEWRVQINGGDYHPYVDMETVETGPESKMISCDFVMEESSDPAPRMCFNLGDEGAGQHLGEHTVYFDNIVLELTDSSNAGEIRMNGKLFDINLNQLGYRPSDEKRAVIRDASKGDLTFSLIDTVTGKTVFEKKTGDVCSLGTSGDSVRYADFSEFDTPGTYRIETPFSGRSVDFSIGENVYDDAASAALKMLYLQRCGTELPAEYAADHAHGICHTKQARIYGKKDSIDVSGGWHDAGDYGRYTSPAAKAVADLLLAYEKYPDVFDDANNTPESGNGIPDILDEARYELEWLLKMQSPEGGVYHKVTGLNFDGFVRADECTAELYVLPESKTSSADFAGVMYMAARVYSGIDDGFAKLCMERAASALDWYEEHIDERNYVNPKDVLTGEYGDGCSADEYLWAICEGYKTTSDEKFIGLMEEFDMDRIESDGLGWDDMSVYAYYAYLTAPVRTDVLPQIEERFYAWVDSAKESVMSGEAYGCSLSDDYPWGSNMYVANYGMAFLMAYDMKGDEDYRLAAKRQLDYLFGNNTNSYCFLTGYGTQSPEHPHHRPSQAIGKCMPGMLVGGPDSYLEDAYAKSVLSGKPKAKCYVDNEQSYSCNEVTIYWNSPLVYLIAGLR